MVNQKALRFIQAQLLEDKRRVIDFPTLLALLTSMTVGKQQQLLKAIRGKNSSSIGKIILDLISDSLEADAKTRAQAILSDDTLSKSEIDVVFKNL